MNEVPEWARSGLDAFPNYGFCFSDGDGYGDGECCDGRGYGDGHGYGNGDGSGYGYGEYKILKVGDITLGFDLEKES